MKLNVQDSFNKELPADPILENSIRQVSKSCFSFVNPKKTKNPSLVHSSIEVQELLGINKKEVDSQSFTEIFTGNKILKNTKPFAMCYGGYQFGNWAGQLGDGRAINLAEIEHNNLSWAIQLKGAGETPYSRTADGLAVLRSSVREYLCSEAMFHLGVPTTRALSLALTGDQVLRDILYDGNQGYEKGAIVCRVAPSFLRFGSFEIFAVKNEIDTLKTLVDYTIKQFYPKLGIPSKSIYLQFFKEVASKTLNMIIHWQRVGFVHGVMNTDNLSILGLTIDYGPYGWLEGYDHNWTPNTTDLQHKRYRYGNQPNIGLWNLLQLANALYALIEETSGLESILDEYKTEYEQKNLQMMRSKLGLILKEKSDNELIEVLENLLHQSETDMTIFYRKLADLNKEDSPETALQKINFSFYQPLEIVDTIERKWLLWLGSYLNRILRETLTNSDRKTAMNLTNPKYVLRNYMAQLAIEAADKGNYNIIDELYKLLKNPYDEQKKSEKWFAKRPDWAKNKIGCSMLSCSS
ncbi:YdiU family protein [Flavicella sp.]|uniref:protein adenylyltransferase SelO n=1 Tax=Flavicella sp. TaxID=2957742 RepID=UPI003019BF77